LGFSEAIIVRWSSKGDKCAIDEFPTGFRFLLLQQFLIAIIIVIGIYLFCSDGHKYFGIMLSGFFVTSNILLYFVNFMESTKQFRYASIMRVVNGSVAFLVIIGIIMVGCTNSLFVIYSMIGVNIITCIYVIVDNRKVVLTRFNINKSLIMGIDDIKKSVFLLWARVAYDLDATLDKMIVLVFLSTYDFSVYSFAAGIIVAIHAITWTVSRVVFPYLSTMDNEIRIKSYTPIRIVSVIFGIVIMGVYFPAEIIVNHWIPSYRDCLPILAILLCGIILNSLIQIVQVSYLKVYRMNTKLLISTITPLALSVILNIVALVIWSSPILVAVVTLVCNVVGWIIAEFQLKKIIPKATSEIWSIVLMITIFGMFFGLLYVTSISSIMCVCIYYGGISVSIILFRAKIKEYYNIFKGRTNYVG
jgi:O-antigen/teichoic acid export membrane protein